MGVRFSSLIILPPSAMVFTSLLNLMAVCIFNFSHAVERNLSLIRGKQTGAVLLSKKARQSFFAYYVRHRQKSSQELGHQKHLSPKLG